MADEEEPNLDWAVELTGEVIRQTSLFLVSTTRSPEALVANAYIEHKYLDQYKQLLQLHSSPDTLKAEVWDQVLQLLIAASVDIRNAVKNSIMCYFTEGICWTV